MRRRRGDAVVEKEAIGWEARMNYRSVADLNDDVARWVNRLPRNLDLIVGVPRSGLLAATLLALHLNLPLTDVDGYLAGRLLGAGPRLGGCQCRYPRGAARRVLVVDDSIWSGRQLAAVREKIEAAQMSRGVFYAAIYAIPSAVDLVDYYCKIVGLPRAFEWNILHHPSLSSSCVVADGLLWPAGAFVAGVEHRPLPRHLDFVPSQEIGCLVAYGTAETHQSIIEFLDRHGVVYRDLAVLRVDTVDPSHARSTMADRKATIYQQTRAWIFVEPSLDEAICIATKSARPVYCVDTRQMIYPGVTPARRHPLLRHRIRWKFRDVCARAEGKMRAVVSRVV